MNCMKCGALIPDDSDFCPVCGATIAADTPDAGSSASKTDMTANSLDEKSQKHSTPVSGNKPEPEKPKSAEAGSLTSKGDTACLVGIVAGILFTVVGLLIMIIASPGCETTSFGGDAYTFIYQGIVAIANGVALMARAMGGCLAAIGVFMACYFWRKRRS